MIYLKDFRRLHLEFPSLEECKDVVDALEVLSKPGLSLLLDVTKDHSSYPFLKSTLTSSMHSLSVLVSYWPPAGGAALLLTH